MLTALPTQVYLLCGLCLAGMTVSAFFMGAPHWWQRGLARSGLVLSCGVLFVGVSAYVSLLAASVVVILPIVVLVAWFTDLFGGFF